MLEYITIKINPKFINANKNKDAIKMLPEIISFLGSIATADSMVLNDSRNIRYGVGTPTTI